MTDVDVVHEGYPHPWTNQHAEAQYCPADVVSDGEGADQQSGHLEDGGDHCHPPGGDDFQQRRHRETRRVHEDREDDDGQTKFFFPYITCGMWVI